MLAGRDLLHVEGFPWIGRDNSKKMSPASLAAKVLCTHHNSALSPLDSEALRFFSQLRYEGDSEVTSIDGELLERWYLKVLIGSVLASSTRGVKQWSPPQSWLHILFGMQRFAPETGLLFPISGRKFRGVYNGVDMQVSYEDPERTIPAGLYLRLGWMASYLGMVPGIGPNEWSFSYRPCEVSISYPDKKKVVTFPWNGIPARYMGPIPDDPT
jgi:hypothetical protein